METEASTMVLSIPQYIYGAKIQETTIRYRWDDWNIEEAEAPIDDELFKHLCGISQRANVAFAVASAAWIVHRFEALLDDAMPLQHLEAATAQMIDALYSFPWQFVEEETWNGPIKGPIRREMELVNYALEALLIDAEPALSAATIAKLAEHVISEPKPYMSWRDNVVSRLQRLYPIDPEEKMGEVVPWQALDPSYDFKIEQTEFLINQFLAGLGWRTNPFLNSPQEMVEQGFKGTPYVFDIGMDRKERFEW